jgi:hypothetical protein
MLLQASGTPWSMMVEERNYEEKMGGMNEREWAEFIDRHLKTVDQMKAIRHANVIDIYGLEFVGRVAFFKETCLPNDDAFEAE